MKKLGIILVILAVLFFWVKGAYNGLVTKDEEVKKTWAEVQNQYQRRMDLINNLVATVNGAANFIEKRYLNFENKKKHSDFLCQTYSSLYNFIL